ncbi:hypothetical protein Syun_018202 [Stephania yunnanensis]|uniref:Uncharacterized protein n=1 Tax=Stephania yunnanensis TaxID=152371 RepID=A0AAP0ISW3_9MAGN
MAGDLSITMSNPQVSKVWMEGGECYGKYFGLYGWKGITDSSTIYRDDERVVVWDYSIKRNVPSVKGGPSCWDVCLKRECFNYGKIELGVGGELGIALNGSNGNDLGLTHCAASPPHRQFRRPLQLSRSPLPLKSKLSPVPSPSPSSSRARQSPPPVLPHRLCDLIASPPHDLTRQCSRLVALSSSRARLCRHPLQSATTLPLLLASSGVDDCVSSSTLRSNASRDQSGIGDCRHPSPVRHNSGSPLASQFLAHNAALPTHLSSLNIMKRLEIAVQKIYNHVLIMEECEITAKTMDVDVSLETLFSQDVVSPLQTK